MKHINFERFPPFLLKFLSENSFKIDLIKHSSAWSAHIYQREIIAKDSGEAFGGTAFTPSDALSKAFSEFVERSAYSILKRDSKYAFLLGTTGFAARPFTRLPRLITQSQVRNSSLMEASERFHACRWWDDTDVAYSLYNLDLSVHQSLKALDIDAIFTKVLLIEIKCIEFEEVLILIGYYSDGGFSVGCAAGKIWSRSHTIFRAAVELMRHGRMALSYINESIQPKTRYAEKVVFLATGKSDKALDLRLSKRGSLILRRPKVIFDEPIPHSFSRHYYVHGLCFENQPDILADITNIII